MKAKLSQLLTLAPVALAALAPMGARAAAVDYFLKIEGVEGESTDKNHPKEIVLDSFSLSGANSVSTSTAGGAGAGKVTFQDLSATAKISKVQPQLFLKTANGQVIPTVTLSARRSGAAFDFYTIKLTNVSVTSIQTAGRTGEIPTDTFTLYFSKINWKYTPLNEKGAAGTPVEATWDVKANKGS